MKLSELKAIVDRETERMQKFRQDPEVVILDKRLARPKLDGREEVRPVHPGAAFIAEGESIDAQCSDLCVPEPEWDESFTLYANRAYFVITGDDPTDFL